ncbi:HD family phosphohydrolase [Desulfurivibrio alkaliphilus]|uniref:Metal dependent phosphohydrolase n=1 Tax=Desulfurivibrio alkaliphilus (strain DSM 19089 / UNIQEM U267 / AHT2) TaxID=589865 RepID=D6YZZ0_DESAT|nr:HD family phosphohydrolase [Desulfurivibrio alkaliphilus]ADH85147.1 metal dependent phosphohydrolase [Desulfurivibrio alkaliphilus AHT 2]
MKTGKEPDAHKPTMGDNHDRQRLQNHLAQLAAIGIALSAEHDLPVLLEKIVDEARAFANADAGTLYLLDDHGRHLEFAIIQNTTMGVRMGGSAGPITWPPVPLYIDGAGNHTNVSSHTALTGEIVNIPDVYQAKGFDFSGTRQFDAGTGYRSVSMLLIPMQNKEGEIIGVLQLINAQDQQRRPIPFPPEDVDLIASLASQAAVAITNVRLYRDLENLFDAFIKTIAITIDEKSPHTAGHIRRVQALTMDIAQAMNEDRGRFRDFQLNTDELRELSIAAWLHDIGKIVTPERLVSKATKLEALHDRIALVKARYEIHKRDRQIQALRQALARQQPNPAGPDNGSGPVASAFEKLEVELTALDEEQRFLEQCNLPTEHLDEKKIARLQEIAARPCTEGNRECRLTADELDNLSIRKGTLNDKERKIIENHVLVTHKMLSELPFPKKLRQVPQYAAGHHEKLDGSGYPFGLTADRIPLPTRIIAIADIFEALTAPDRPYKKPMPLSRALEIMESMQQAGHIDPDILAFFIEHKVYRHYAKRELSPAQQDC